jgi:hypothetical protein
MVVVVVVVMVVVVVVVMGMVMVMVMVTKMAIRMVKVIAMTKKGTVGKDQCTIDLPAIHRPIIS